MAAVASAGARELAEMLYLVDEPTVIDDSRFRAMFGARTTPHELAIADTVAWFRAAVPVAA